MTNNIITLVGNPRARSRTNRAALQAAQAIADRIENAALGETIDLAALAPELPTASSAAVESALDLVTAADVLVAASPTYKGTYTGLLKTFLDRLPGYALTRTIAVPLLVMGDAKHALAVETHFRPLLVELGAHVPTPGIVLLESQLPDAEQLLDAWADRAAPQIAALLTASAPTPAFEG
ncbi:NAD(P)H-dependent oxidoreductase [Actinomadura sp. NPDC000929]|uniref:NADPH-dependent FMN reductase n=1 Tax=Actinomadura sp. NPDC000929 TaxID=3154517 RepID=UPI0033954FCD